MATVIDSLVLEIGLDPSKFTRGQRDALNSLRQLESQSKQIGGNVEKSSKGAAESMSRMRTEVLALGAAAIGGAGIAGFVKGLISTNQQLGFTSRLIGTSVETLALWRNAARFATGGTGEGVLGLFRSINGEIYKLKATGDSAITPLLRTLGVNPFDRVTGQVRESQAIIEDVLAALQRVGPGEKAFFLRGIGADDDTLNFFLGNVGQFLDAARKLGGATRENAEIAREATNVWSTFQIALEDFGNRTIVDLRDSLDQLGNMRVLVPGGLADRVLSNFIDTKPYQTPNTLGKKLGLEDIGRDQPANRGGGESAGVFALRRQLEAQGFRVTSTTGGQHAGEAHGRGLAVDFVPQANIPGEAARLRAQLERMGIGARVIDASTPDSKAWTAPHVHVEFNSPADASRFAAMQGGAGGAAGGNRSNTVNINGGINVQTRATDAAGIARGIGGAVNATLSNLPAQVGGGQTN